MFVAFCIWTDCGLAPCPLIELRIWETIVWGNVSFSTWPKIASPLPAIALFQSDSQGLSILKAWKIIWKYPHSWEWEIIWSSGVGGLLTPPLWAQCLFISMQFLTKIGQGNRLVPTFGVGAPVQVILDPPLQIFYRGMYGQIQTKILASLTSFKWFKSLTNIYREFVGTRLA